MNTIGNKISEIRKRKGLTQEELSDLAKINLRTLQRIENRETEPRSHTLKSLCEILEINIEEILDSGKTEDKSYLTYLHLSVLAGMIIPLGNIILPFILWITKKDKIVTLREQGINLINFQINWTLFLFLTLILMNYQLLPFIRLRIIGPIELYIIANLLVNFIYPIIVSIFINIWNPKLYYPALIRFIR